MVCFVSDPKLLSGALWKEINVVGLDYFGARYFSAAQGRFTTPDWSPVPEPVPYAVLTDPQTLNLYAYVRNNPLKLPDIDGHQQPDQFSAEQIQYMRQKLLTPAQKEAVAKLDERTATAYMGAAALISVGPTYGAAAAAAEAGAIGTAATSTMMGASLIAIGTIQIIGSVANVPSEKLDAAVTGAGGVATPAALTTTIFTGSPQLGAAVSDLQAGATAVAKPAEAAKDPAGTALTLNGLIQDVKSLVAPVPPPPSPPPPPTRQAGVDELCRGIAGGAELAPEKQIRDAWSVLLRILP